jgi:hypothetical protein
MTRLMQQVFKIPLIMTVLFLFGLLFGMTARDGSHFRTVWVESYLKMHSSLVPGTSSSGLIVVHNNFSALSELALAYPAILTIKESQFSNIAYVTAEGNEESALRLLRESPFVRFAARNQIVFFCH